MRLSHLLHLPKAPAARAEGRAVRFSPSPDAWLRCVWTNYCCYDAAAPKKDTIVFTNLPEDALPERRCTQLISGSRAAILRDAARVARGRTAAAAAGLRPRLPEACLVPVGGQHMTVYEQRGAPQRSAWPAAFALAALRAGASSAAGTQLQLQAARAAAADKAAAAAGASGGTLSAPSGAAEAAAPQLPPALGQSTSGGLDHAPLTQQGAAGLVQLLALAVAEALAAGGRAPAESWPQHQHEGYQRAGGWAAGAFARQAPMAGTQAGAAGAGVAMMAGPQDAWHRGAVRPPALLSGSSPTKAAACSCANCWLQCPRSRCRRRSARLRRRSGVRGAEWCSCGGRWGAPCGLTLLG